MRLVGDESHKFVRPNAGGKEQFKMYIHAPENRNQCYSVKICLEKSGHVYPLILLKVQFCLGFVLAVY